MSSLTGYNPTPSLSNPFVSGPYRHVALSISGTTHTLYLDGSAVAINTNAGNIFATYSAINNIYIGCAGDLSYGYTGIIDDFKIWNRALPSSDISAIYYANKGYPLNNISSSAQGYMLNKGTHLQAGALGLYLLNSEYTGPCIKIKNGLAGTPTDFYASRYGYSGVNYLTTITGTTLSTFLSGATAYVTIWYDQTGNQNHAYPVGTPIYNTTTNTIDFTSGYFRVKSDSNLLDDAFPTGNKAYSYLFTPNNQTTVNNYAYSGGTLAVNLWVGGNLYYSFSPNNAKYNNSWYANVVWYDKGSGGYLNGVKIADCYNGGKSSERTLYLNGVSQTITEGNTEARNQAAGNNYIGHSDYTGENTVNYTGTFQYFYWAPTNLSVSDINILGNT